MLKKKLGIEGIEVRWIYPRKIWKYYKIPSTLIIPEGCERIGNLDGCRLKKVIIPEGVNRICYKSFMYCLLLKEVVIPESVVVIEKDAFAWCASLEKVMIPRGVVDIGIGAFRECRRAEITLYESATIGENAFFNCKSVEYVKKETRT